ncbi:MAG: zinc-binding dehydrogenase [Phycisphaerae bacterium]|nr:zinc-binding dehydrogenase [Phycisphaerae bacterium]
MRAVVTERQGTPVALNVSYRTDWPDAHRPGPGHVMVRTLASALNQMDLWVGRGVPGLELEYPRISGCDACGVVEALGDDVEGAWLDQRVIVNAAIAQPQRVVPDDPPARHQAPEYELIGEHHSGMLASHFLAPVESLAPVGQNADPTQAAAFGLCHLTAYSMLVTKAQCGPGQTVLIAGIGGGLATAALDIARYLGCRVAVTSRHQWKLDKAGALGAELRVLDKGQDWSKEVRAWTQKRGVDVVVDSVGKPVHLSCLKSLARGGAYVTPGCTGGHDPTTDLRRIFWNQLRILGSTMGTKREFDEIAALFRAGRLRAAVDRVFPAAQASEAFARLEAGEQCGKIVLTW